MRPTSLIAMVPLLCLTGCARWIAGGPTAPAPSDTAVLAELGVIAPRVERKPRPQCGPSLVAGDGVAMHWALAHGVIAAEDAGPWQPAVLVMD